MFALVDGNNFFVSCERVFRPDLENTPVAVLSSNDGCIIARSEEVKKLGVAMGIPLFKVKHLISRHDIRLFSSNFALYSDMSERLMNCLEYFTNEVEQYSIDEAFLKIQDKEINALELGLLIKKKIHQWLGLPIGIGFGPTKTLAKIANHLAKRSITDVCILDSIDKIQDALKRTHINDVWGIGYKSAGKLTNLGINTAYDLSQADPKWIRQIFSVIGEKIVKELQGISCLPLEAISDPHKSMQVTRSFGRPITSLVEMKEAIFTYLDKLGKKLRNHNLKAKALLIFFRANRFKTSFRRLAVIHFPRHLNDTSSLIKYSAKALEEIFVEGKEYTKAGVMALGLTNSLDTQLTLLDNLPNSYERNNELSNTLDFINKRFGSKTVIFAGCGINPKWLVKSDNKSPSYTTNWQELAIVKAC